MMLLDDAGIGRFSCLTNWFCSSYQVFLVDSGHNAVEFDFVPCDRGPEAQVRLFLSNSEAFWVCQMGNNDGTSQFGGVKYTDPVEIYPSVFTGTNGV